MLSKSQARLFFLGGTILFSLIFLWLTLDTIRQTPARTHMAAMDEQVLLGRKLWDENNCMGCHTILGEGAYYAPELTNVLDRKHPEWIRAFIRNPQAFYPGRRKMVAYDFTDEEIDGLIAWFRWVQGIDTNGFPKDPPLREWIKDSGQASVKE